MDKVWMARNRIYCDEILDGMGRCVFSTVFSCTLNFVGMVFIVVWRSRGLFMGNENEIE